MSELIVRNLQKRFGKKTVVENASFSVGAGEVVGLLGANGAGKTTSFYMTIGLIRADSGEIILNGQNITHFTMDKRARLGLAYLPQEASVFRHLTVRDNVLAILELTSKLSAKERFQRADELLYDLSLTHKADTLGVSLSGGERRRCEIARALATNPRFILLDEPFAGVDPLAVQEIRNIINHLKERNIGVLITDHNVRETLKSCQRAYILNAGTVVAEGTPSELINNPTAKKLYLGEDFIL